jgi:Zn-dependent protease
MDGNFSIGRFGGIEVRLNWSLIAVFALIAWSLADGVFPSQNPGLSHGTYVAMGIVAAVLFLVSILLHELGHSLVARREGIEVDSITLWLFGGVARMSRDTTSPGAEFRIAVAGPIVTLLIAAACVVAGVVAGADEFWDAMRFEDAGISGGVALLAWLATINVFVLGFNLIPAFPLDGGRIARAIAWRITGDRARATRFAATLGQGFSYLFIAFGIYLALIGDVISGIWLALVGFILGSAARGAKAQTDLSGRIAGITVADVMDSDPVAIPEDASVERALDEFFLRYRWPWFPVVDPTERFLGLIERGAADAVPEVSRTSSTVRDVFEALGSTRRSSRCWATRRSAALAGWRRSTPMAHCAG